jgi:broad specificity phosphatase PhoE
MASPASPPSRDSNWVFLRHGQSRANLEGTLAGWSDVPLTPLGEEEARNAGDRLVHVTFDEVVASDLIRAKETARIALARWSELTGKPTPALVLDPELRERTVGDWEGKPRAFLREHGQLALLASWEGRAPGGGESHADLAKRAMSALARYTERRVLFVCHGGVMRVVMGLLDGIPLEEIGSHTPANAEIIVRTVDAATWAVAYEKAVVAT